MSAQLESGWQAFATGQQLASVSKSAEAIVYFQRARAAAINDGDIPLQCAALQQISFELQATGDHCGALALLEESVATARNANAHRELCSSLSSLGQLCRKLEQPEKGRTYFEESLSVAQKLGDATATGYLLGNIAYLHRMQGCLREALHWYMQLVAHEQHAGSKANESAALHSAATVCEEMHDYIQARDLLQSRLHIAQELRDGPGECTALEMLARASSHLRSTKDARRFLDMLRARADDLDLPDVKMRAFSNLAATLCTLREFKAARRIFLEMQKLAKEEGDPLSEVEAIRQEANLHQLRRANAAARRTLERAIAVAVDADCAILASTLREEFFRLPSQPHRLRKCFVCG